MRKIQWRVVPAAAPAVLRYCKKCGRKTSFISSDLFRVNAQKKSLDIWLIYNCVACRTSWNATIHSRIPPQALDRETLEAYHQNDPALAAAWAGNISFLRSLGCEVEIPEFIVEGECFSPDESVELEILATCPLPIKVSTLVREKLGISRREYDDLIAGGRLTSLSASDLSKCKLNDCCQMLFNKVL